MGWTDTDTEMKIRPKVAMIWMNLTDSIRLRVILGLMTRKNHGKVELTTAMKNDLLQHTMAINAGQGKTCQFYDGWVHDRPVEDLKEGKAELRQGHDTSFKSLKVV